LVLSGLFCAIPSCAAAQLDKPAKSIITARFILWDTQEKMIDNDFQIHLFTYNASSNYSSSYVIKINEQVMTGNFTFNTTVDISLTNTEIISLFQIYIDDVLIMQAENIIVIKGITGAGIKQSATAFLIELNPLEWSRQKWSIFWAMMTAFIFAIYPSYKIVKAYRRHRGVQEIK
jgi:hypothetical protein